MEWTGYYRISGCGGSSIRFSPYENGCDQLLAKVARHLPDDDPPVKTVSKLELVLVKSR